MLTREDIDDLFGTLAIFRPKDPHLSSKKLRTAWHMALSPYERGDVREAVGAWFRQSKYWPEPAEIAALCPPLPEKKQAAPPAEPEAQDVQKRLARWRTLAELRREAGVPATASEAKAAGLADGAWLDLLAERGLAWE